MYTKAVSRWMLFTLFAVGALLIAVSYPRVKTPSAVATDPLRNDKTLIFVDTTSEKGQASHQIARFKSGDERVSILSASFPTDPKLVLMSPDKSMLAVTYIYASEAPPKTYILNVDGTQLTEPVPGGISSWAADSSKLYLSVTLGEAGQQYVRDGESGNEDVVFSLSRDGSYEREVFEAQIVDVVQNPRTGAFAAKRKDYGSGNSEILLLSRDGGLVQVIRSKQGDSVSKLSWSPDGKSLTALVNTDQKGDQAKEQLILMKQAGDKWESVLIDDDVLWETTSWSPDSSMVAYSKQDGQGQHVLSFNIVEKTKLNVSAFEKYRVWSPTFDTDGNLYFIADSGQACEVWVHYSDKNVKLTDTVSQKSQLHVL